MVREEPLLLSSLHYNVHHRSPKDKAWGWAYSLCLGVTLAYGAVCALSRPDFLLAIVTNDSERYLEDPSNCPLTVMAGGPGSGATAADGGGTPTVSLVRRVLSATGAADWGKKAISNVPEEVVRNVGLLLLISGASAALLGYLFTFALWARPHAMVKLACLLQVGAPLLASGLAFNAGNTNTGLILLGVACMMAISFFLFQESLALVGRILGLSGTALRDNPSLIVLVIGTKLALLLGGAAVVAAAASAIAAGDILPNPARRGSARCATPSGLPLSCCVWQPSQLLPAYLPLAAVAGGWTLLLLLEAKVYAVAGVVTQWYFAPVGHAPPSFRALGLSLGHAFGPSFGSICLASGVLGLTSYIRGAVQRSWRSRDGMSWQIPSLLSAVVGCCCSCFAALLEQLTKFSVIRMAMSGQGFWDASYDVIAMMRRDGLDAYSMWWYLPMVLQSTAAALSGAWGYGAYWLARTYWPYLLPGVDGGRVPTDALCAALGLLAGGISWMALAFICGVILNIGDAMFVCYALDRDSRACTRYEVHQVYQCLPCCAAGSAVQQPDGTYMYGAPQHHPGAGRGAHVHVDSSQWSHGQDGWRLGQPVTPPAAHGRHHTAAGSGSGGGYFASGHAYPPPMPPPAGNYYPPIYPQQQVYSHTGLPVGPSASGYRRDRGPAYPPPAVLSPPYSERSYQG